MASAVSLVVLYKMASMDAVDFMSRMEQGKLSVHQLMQSEASTLVQSNRQKIKSILKAITITVIHNLYNFFNAIIKRVIN